MRLTPPVLAPARGRSPLAPLIARLSPSADERRQDQRSSFGYSLLLTPLDEAGELLGDQTELVQGRDLSARGVGFEHGEPLPYRRVRLTASDPRLEAAGLGGLTLEIALRWCRFVAPGRYESGGQVTASAT